MDVSPIFFKITLFGLDTVLLIWPAIVLGIVFAIFKRNILKLDIRKIILFLMFSVLMITISRVSISLHPKYYEEPPAALLDFIRSEIPNSIRLLVVIPFLIIAYVFSCLIVWIYDKVKKKS